MMDSSEIIEEMLTCNICENIGFWKGTTLLLLPKCQHYICETCMHTMRERASANDETTIECPFCRVPFSVNDEQSTPRFRYAECLADKVLTDGKKKRNKKPAANSTGIHKPLLMKEFDITNAQIIRFIQFGDSTDLYTSAGAVSLDFSNGGMYMMELGSGRVRQFGAEACRYDGLAFTDGKLFAVNYTQWRVEVYETRSHQNRLPRLEASYTLKHPRPESAKEEQGVVIYIDDEGLHLLCNCDHIVFHLSENSTKIAKHDLELQSEPQNLQFVSKNEQWYMKGDQLVQSCLKSKKKNQYFLPNWTSIALYEAQKILFTVKESANIFILDIGHIKKDGNLRQLKPSSFQRSSKQNYKQVIISNTSSIPVKLATSEHGQLAMVGHHNQRRVIQLYACQQTVVQKAVIQIENIAENKNEKMPESLTLLRKGIDILSSLFITFVIGPILYILIKNYFNYGITVLMRYFHPEVMIPLPKWDWGPISNWFSGIDIINFLTLVVMVIAINFIPFLYV